MVLISWILPDDPGGITCTCMHSIKIVNNFKYMLCKQHFVENREKNFLQKNHPFLFISENENSYELNQQLDILSYFFLLHKLCSMFGIPFFALTATMRYFIASHFLQL